jgi:hypothetical protein
MVNLLANAILAPVRTKSLEPFNAKAKAPPLPLPVETVAAIAPGGDSQAIVGLTGVKAMLSGGLILIDNIATALAACAEAGLRPPTGAAKWRWSHKSGGGSIRGDGPAHSHRNVAGDPATPKRHGSAVAVTLSSGTG